MIQTLLDYWEFVREGFFASLIVGLVLPLVGALVYLRRSAFLGVAVPQFSAAGVSLGLWLLPWFPALNEEFLEHGHPSTLYLFGFAVLGAGLALAWFSWMQSRQPGSSAEARLAAGFVIATATSMLLLNQVPLGHQLADTLLHGEVLVLDVHGLTQLGVVYSVVLVGLCVFRRAFVLFAFDPDCAAALGHRAAPYDRLQMLLVGLAIGAGVMTVGPILVFGMLFLPPLAARQVARTMRGFAVHVSLVGVMSVSLAWPVSLLLELPYGPTSVACGALLVAVYAAAGRVLASRADPRSGATPA